MMFNWLTYCLMQWRQHECRSESAVIKLTDDEMWDTLKRKWENMLLKLEVKVKEKIVELKGFCTAEKWCDSLSVI